MDWPPLIDGRRATSVGTGSSIGTSITAPTNGTKSAYTQLIASTSFDAMLVVLNLTGSTFGNPADVFVDLAIGAAGSEQIIASDLMVGGSGTARYVLPLRIPAGTRVAARVSSSQTASNAACSVNLQLGAGGMMGMAPFNRCDALGISSNAGTTVTAGGSANTKGSWAQIIASTARMYRALILAGRGPNGAAANLLGDVGVGAAAAEQVVVPDVPFNQTSSGGTDSSWGCASALFPCVVPSGSRVAGRVQAQAASQACRLAVYGLA